MFLSVSYIDGVLCVIPEGYQDKYQKIFARQHSERLLDPVVGGETRKDSVYAGLNALSKYHPDFVLIHDAARCYCDSETIDNVAGALKCGSKAVVPAISPIDSVRFRGKNINRDNVKLIQTPQGFCFDLILLLHEKYPNLSLTDDASLCDMEGIKVTLVEGDIKNKKITYRADIDDHIFKTGFGYDVHRFSEDVTRRLFLMGCEIPNFIGLDGVSDADVGIHSLVDAILGTLGEGSIGEHFTANDPKNKNADSKIFLNYCKELLQKQNAVIVNTDTTIVCEKPNIASYAPEMKKVIADCLDVDVSKINIKGKTTEGLGFEGRKEGISAYSIVTLKISENN